MEDIETEAPTMGYKSLTDGQEMVLALLPIPSGILSLFGNWIVIQMAFRMRKAQSWSPYQALLTGMSVCSIFYTITNMLGSFLYPRETSNKVWAFGNEASCKTIGVFNQFGTSVMMYQAMLALYFLLAIRFGLSNDAIIKRYETIMHVVAVGWPTLSSFAGLFLEVYGERQTSLGCYIDECPFDDNGQRIACDKSIYSHLLGRGSYIFTFFVLITSNIMISRHLRQQMKRHSRNYALEHADGMPAESDDHFSKQDSDIELTLEDKRMREESRRNRQQRNLHRVRYQAILFVGGFLLCNVVTYFLNFTVGDVRRIDLAPGASPSYQEEMELPYKYYPFLVLQSLLLPLQGFINCVIYARPQYVITRRHFPQERRLWACRRAVYGDVIEPTARSEALHHDATDHPHKTKVRPKSTRVAFDGSKRSDDTGTEDHSNEEEEEDHPHFEKK